jgi:hypothetical protein
VTLKEGVKFEDLLNLPPGVTIDEVEISLKGIIR